jgi:gas vesicle protein
VNHDRDNGGANVFVAFLAGLAVGAGAALLLAPKSGAETRADIARQARRARVAAKELADQTRMRAASAYDSARTVARERMQDAKRGVEHVLDDVKTRVDAGREAGVAGARAAREELNRRLADMRTDRTEKEGNEA